MSSGALLLAHQGGWDEALLIGGPIVVIVGLLMLAKRRVDAAHAAQSTGQDVGEVGGGDGDRHDGQAVEQHTGRDTDRRPADG